MGWWSMDLDSFETLVGEVLDSLPDEFLQRLENVQIEVSNWPSEEDLAVAGLPPGARSSLLGLYHGVPITDRGIYYMSPPDRIVIYKGPIEAHAGPDDMAVKEQVRRTVIHEVAHYYGLDEERLEELGWD